MAGTRDVVRSSSTKGTRERGSTKDSMQSGGSDKMTGGGPRRINKINGIPVVSTFGPESDRWGMIKELGGGMQARVWKCIRESQPGREFAVKVIEQKKTLMESDQDLQVQYLLREAEILKKLSHPKIVNLEECSADQNMVYVIMEYMPNGDLFDKIAQKKGFKEREARYIFQQLLEALEYMHEKSVLHRDLKPENILIKQEVSLVEGTESFSYYDVKIADFGLSKAVTEHSVAKTYVGTPYYWAPEVLNTADGCGKKSEGSGSGDKSMQKKEDSEVYVYDNRVDLWSLGVVLYVMLCGHHPFNKKREMPLTDQIRRGMSVELLHQDRKARDLSRNAQDLILRLLQCEPEKRITLTQCRKHPWCNDEYLKNHIHPLAPRIAEIVGGPADKKEAKKAEEKEAAEKGPSQHAAPPQFPSRIEASGAAPPPTGAQGETKPTTKGTKRGGKKARKNAEKNGEKNAVTTEGSPTKSVSGPSAAASAVTPAPVTNPPSSPANFFANLPRKMSRKCVIAMFSLITVLAGIGLNQFEFDQLDLQNITWQNVRKIITSAGGLEIPSEIREEILKGSPLDGRPMVMDLVPKTKALIPHNNPSPPHPSVGGEETDGEETKHSTTTLSPEGGDDTDDTTNPETQALFRELLTLQLEIARSLETAYMAYRSADYQAGLQESSPPGKNSKMRAETMLMVGKLRLLAEKCFEVTANSAYKTIMKYGATAKRVREEVLPDMELALEENAPELAEGFLETIDIWVQEMQVLGTKVENEYKDLSVEIHSLIESTHLVKASVDKAIMEAPVTRGFSHHPKTTPAIALMLPHSDAGAGVISAVGGHQQQRHQQQQQQIMSEQQFKSIYDKVHRLISEMDMQLDGPRQDLLVDNGDNDKVVDLLFPRPPVLPSPPPRGNVSEVSPSNKDEDCSSASASSLGEMEVSSGAPSCPEAPEERKKENDDILAPTQNSANSALQISSPALDFVHQAFHDDQDSYLQSVRQQCAIALMRAVQALRQVASVLSRSTLFWTHLGTSTHAVAQMKSMLQKWIRYASSNQRLKQRLKIRLQEYSNFWRDFEIASNHYCRELLQGRDRMFHFLSQMESRANYIDTVKAIVSRDLTNLREKSLENAGVTTALTVDENPETQEIQGESEE